MIVYGPIKCVVQSEKQNVVFSYFPLFSSSLLILVVQLCSRQENVHFFKNAVTCCFIGLSTLLVNIATMLKGGQRGEDIGEDRATRTRTAVSPAPGDQRDMCKCALLRNKVSQTDWALKCLLFCESVNCQHVLFL